MKDATGHKRAAKGFAQASSHMQKAIGKIGEKRGFSQTRLLTNWPEIVGEQLAKIAQPIKVSYARKGLGAKLVLLVHGANAPMVQMQIPELIKKVNASYGFNAIQDIKLTQVDSYGLAETASEFSRRDTKPLSDAARKQIEQMVDDVSDKGLKSALTNLGENVAQRKTRKDNS